MRLQPEQEQIIPHLKPLDASSRVKQERIETPWLLRPSSRRLSPLQGLETPSFNFSDNFSTTTTSSVKT